MSLITTEQRKPILLDFNISPVNITGNTAC